MLQLGFVQGLMHILLLNMSAHLARQLGMAPGGEFRIAYREASKIPGCQLKLGDRPINITLQRAITSLTMWQKLTLAWNLIMCKDPIRSVIGICLRSNDFKFQIQHLRSIQGSHRSWKRQGEIKFCQVKEKVSDFLTWSVSLEFRHKVREF